LEILKSLNKLALQPGFRATIVNDQGCLPGIVLFLDNEDPAVVRLAVETLELLANCAEIRNTMWHELGLVLSLNTIIEGGDTPDGTREVARQTLIAISPPPPTAAQQFETPVAKSRPAQARKPMAPVNTNTASAATASNGNTFFKGGSFQEARNIVLQVVGLDDLHSRKVLENQLLTVKGVVSFTLDMSQSRVTVRVRTTVTAEKLCTAVADSQTLSAQQVVKDKDGQEVVLSFGAGPPGSENNDNMPQYIEDEDDEEEELDNQQIALHSKAIGVASSWFNAASSYVSGSLYW